MIYGSVCSGIESATQAWHPLGWKPAFFSEIEKFPSAVLAHHYPDVPNHGDMTKFEDWPDHAIDLLVGGTPCQSFSVAGLRKGLADPRGNLMLTFGAVARRYRPRWIVWENVPGVLSSDGGRDFGTFLGMLAELGYGFAYRVLDAQYVRTCRHAGAVPQRRRRVFVVGYLGDWRRAAAVLFDAESLSGNPPPRRETRERVARGFETGPTGGSLTDLAPTLDARCKDGPIRNQLGAGVLCADVAPTLNAHFGDKLGLEDQHINGGGGFSLPPVSLCINAGGMGRIDAESETFIPMTGGVFDVAAIQERAVSENTQSGPQGAGFSLDGAAYTLEARNKVQAVAFDPNQITSKTNRSQPDPAVHHTLPATATPPHLAKSRSVRRLTPSECERLQGFPDDFTRIPTASKGAWREVDDAEDVDGLRAAGLPLKMKGNVWFVRDPDGPRYKALGNSMAVNVMTWLGERIAMVEAMI